MGAGRGVDVVAPDIQKQNHEAHESLSSMRKGQRFVATWLRWPGFDTAVGFVLLVDFVLLGMDAEQRLHPEFMSASVRNVCTTLDMACKCVYIIELLLRIYGFGLQWCIRNVFVRIDMFLVGCFTADMLLQLAGSGI